MLNPSIPLVETRHGKIVGVVQEEIHIWRGIPYAAPPTGSYAGVRRSLLRHGTTCAGRIVSPAPVVRILHGVANSAAAIREIFPKTVSI